MHLIQTIQLLVHPLSACIKFGSIRHWQSGSCNSELIREGIEDNSKIIFLISLISQKKIREGIEDNSISKIIFLIS